MHRTTNYIWVTILFSLVAAFTCCSSNSANENPAEIATMVNEGEAAVVAVSTSGNSGNYTFNVTISSPDTGCEQYADWWEVLRTNGTLIYRRILAHSHVNEQPFTRSGSSVHIEESTEVYVRAHMNTNGYGTKVMKGSIANGFQAADLEADFALEVADQEPTPNGCAF